jgi:hypothetical protein
MEGDILRGNSVRPGFRPGYQGKNSQGPFFCPGAYPGVFYQFSYILPGMVIMPAPVVMFMFAATPVSMFVMMFTMMTIRMFMDVMVMMSVRGGVVIVNAVIGPALQTDNRMDAGYTAAIFPDKFQRPAFKPKFGQPGPQPVRIDSQVHKSAQGHIPRNPGMAIKM